jgi:hypothetical protein
LLEYEDGESLTCRTALERTPVLEVLLGDFDYHDTPPLGEYPVVTVATNPGAGLRAQLAADEDASSGIVVVSQAGGGMIRGSFEAEWNLADGRSFVASSSFEVPDCP